jgi:hypothetical protein
MELTAEELYANRERLEKALAAIPPLKLEHFRVSIVRQDYVEILTKPTLSNVRFLLAINLQYEGSMPFAAYITDTGITFTHWTQRDYLTHPVRVAIHAWFQAMLFNRQRVKAKARIALYKEELMAAAWHPRRVERLLAAGGFDALDDC